MRDWENGNGWMVVEVTESRQMGGPSTGRVRALAGQ